MEKMYKIAAAFWLVWLLGGCSEELPVEPATYSKLLTGETSKAWRYQEFVFVFEDENLGQIRLNPGCVFNGTFTFYREGRVLEIEDTCSPLEEREEIGTTWGISNANATLAIGGIEPFDLVTLTANELVFGFETVISITTQGSNIPRSEKGFAQYTYRVQVD